MFRKTNLTLIAAFVLVAGPIASFASAATFSSGFFTSAEDLGWDVGSTSSNAYLLTTDIGSQSRPAGNITVGALSFTDGGNFTQGTYNYFNANFGGAYASQMNTLINPMGLSFNNGSNPKFTGSLGNLSAGVTYRLRLISYDGDNSTTDASARGPWTFTVGTDSASVNAWSALGLSSGTWTNARGSYFQDVFTPTLSGNVTWSLGADTNGKYAMVTALTLEALPEPTTLGLIGVGGILLMRRNRKSV